MPIRKPISKDGAIGKALRPNAGISADFAKPITKLIGLMYRDALRELTKVFEDTSFTSAMDASTTSQARIILNWLLRKWSKRFDDTAKSIVDRMIARTLKNSSVTLGLSLKEVSKDFEIDTTLINERLNEVIKASTQEAVMLIKRIPERFLGDVQGQVMRSITTGNGMKDLVPYLTKKYNGDIKHARLTAADQTRKAYQSINTSRLKTLGIKKFVWIHSGGGKVPRVDHIKMSGNEYSFDDPPVIGEMYGNEVRGLPGDLPNCRCIYKPIINFDLED